MNLILRGSLLATSALAIAFQAPAAFAQEAPAAATSEEPVGENAAVEAEASGEQEQDIVVTGSRNARSDLSNSVPTLVVGNDLFENRLR